jgi:demethylmenaquinone methyltransferase/2-methoxy-6-polyprenyl-1,4-benzoquinol methylase
MLDKKAKYVRDLFSGIPSEYDQLLWMLTLRQDAHWRSCAIREFELEPPARVLDLATGTGVFAFEWIDKYPDVAVTALDITPSMLVHARRVQRRRDRDDSITFVCGRTETLPFPDAHFNAVSIGLALRNLSNLESSFAEMARVVRTGGKVLSVDFTRPENPLIRRIYYLYLCKTLPLIGRTISPEWEETFEYLWRSILRFRAVNDVVGVMVNAGLQDVQVRPLTCGIATLIVGTRS